MLNEIETNNNNKKKIKKKVSYAFNVIILVFKQPHVLD